MTSILAQCVPSARPSAGLLRLILPALRPIRAKSSDASPIPPDFANTFKLDMIPKRRIALASGYGMLHNHRIADMVQRMGLRVGHKLYISFVKASGPGGQNVNKISSKADLRIDLEEIDWLPPGVVAKLKEQNINRLNKSGQMIFTSDRHRTQMANMNDCIEKLYETIIKAGHVALGPTEEKMARVKELQDLEKEKRRERKEKESRARINKKPRDSW
ncbi:uncharacterized protein BJ171DRAFT_567722 [Polychytrium aggregatum]|uniref:uncharacterized protein n=1 Tax=Polychytrium aggregatum TaxID=110093 RepID=UPI0022FE3955|nr:uncharacterized protein BJ171DRAFT_567722 [Polychytrium aggregatum]KAI9205098.1 hypothetical protein BJ171DRAFT_567722 [Polychytrium aggregatum]